MAISKKLLALMCALGLSLAGLAGCGSGSSGSGSNAGGNSGSNSGENSGGSNGGSSNTGAGSDVWEELLSDPGALAYIEATPEGKEYLAVYSSYDLTKELFTGKDARSAGSAPRIFGLSYEEYATLDFAANIDAPIIECNVVDDYSNTPIESVWNSLYPYDNNGRPYDAWNDDQLQPYYDELVDDWKVVSCRYAKNPSDDPVGPYEGVYVTLKDGSMIHLNSIDEWFINPYRWTDEE